MVMNTTTSTLVYEEIRKIVWSFADMVRDKGNGTVEDYAKVVIPTCLLKRTLDLQKEFNDKNGKKYFDLVALGGSTELRSLQELNGKGYRFFDFEKIIETGVQPSIILLTWDNVISYADNPNGEERYVGKEGTLAHRQVYKTKAKNFVELMFEIINVLNANMLHVFDTFEYENLLQVKKIVPTEDFYKTCHAELSKHDFSMQNISSDIFSDLYMDLIGRFASDSGKKGGEFFTPTPLVRDAWQFVDLEEISQKLSTGEKTSLSIGDPTAGSNTFLMYGYDMIMEQFRKMNPGKELDKNVFSFYGQELKAFQYCLGLINMIFHNQIDSYNRGIGITNQNSNVINNYYAGIGQKREQLDIVVANPPYGVKDYGISYAESTKITDSRWKYGVPKRQEGEFAFLMTILDLLNKQGKAVVVMPLGTLFRDGGKAFREHLIKDDFIEGLVTLPGNMFLTTQIPVVLWILNKNKKEADKGKIFMVNASKDFKKIGKFNEWQSAKAIENYLTRTEEEDYSGYVDLEILEKNKFNLSVQRYFSKEKEKEEINIFELQSEILDIETNLQKKKAIMDEIIGQILDLENIALMENTNDF